MAAVVSYNQFLFFLLTSFTAPCQARDFSFVFVLSDSLWDFGLDFRSNIARINLQNLLTQRHPNVTISHEVAHIPSPAFDECDRRFAAWGAAGVPLVLANVREQFCFARLAPAFPNTTFISAGSSLPVGPNFAGLWVRLYQPTYLAGYTAGLMTTVNKICVSTIQPISSVLLDLTGFCHGVHAANPAAEIHVFGTGKIIAPLLEVWIVNQSYAFGCDVMFVHSTFIDGTQRASELGLLSVGYFIDARLTVGETVLTSVMLDLTPGYLRAAEAVLTNTLEAETQRADWWMGWEWGAMALADFSFRVPKSVQAKVLAQVPALDRVFCGRVCTKKGCVCNSSSCCLTDKQLNSLDGQPEFVLDHGVVRLPGEACPPGQLATWHVNAFTMLCTDCPAGTYAYNWAQTSECRPCPAGTYSPPRATDCTPCPPGTFSDGPGQAQCRLCPAGTIAHNSASVSCSLCSSSLSSPARTQCESPSLLWLAGVCCGAVGGLAVIGTCLLWGLRQHGKRNNRTAPKEPYRAFCVLFTDIQSSTSLWAAIPDVMATALDAHHALIRRLIVKYQLYEVKTIGDSFMCATHSPAQAVAFALALQEAFAQYDWGTDRIDHTYAELAAPETTSESPNCWNGLRVRVGIHYGHGDIKLDPVSRGYDYYGTVVNTAARIESVCHGGQTGVSAAVFEALGGRCPGAVWADLGEQPLRGLAEPLRLYQVLPEGRLAHRRFPPLRIDLAHDKEEDVVQQPDRPAPRQAGLRPSVATSVGSHPPPTAAKWAEHHPLVAHGHIAAEDLRRHHDVLHAGLGAVLAPLAPGLRQRVATELCAHFHVPDHGSDGPPLQRTLDGLVKRALPATVQQQRPRPPLCRQPAGRHSGQFDSLPGVPAHSDVGHGQDNPQHRDFSGEELLPDSPHSVRLPLVPENDL